MRRIALISICSLFVLITLATAEVVRDKRQLGAILGSLVDGALGYGYGYPYYGRYPYNYGGYGGYGYGGYGGYHRPHYHHHHHHGHGWGR